MNWKLLARYLSGQCSKDEQIQVKRWLAEDSENREFMCSIKKIWEVEPKNNFEFDVEQAWSRFEEKNIHPDHLNSVINLHKTAPAQIRSSGNNKAWFVYFSAVAAVFLLVFFFVYRSEYSTGNLAADPSHLTMQQIATERGQKTTFTLSDGTKVMLNAESSLRIPATFVNGKREVFLKGEAYFEVTHIANASFIVHSGNFSTHVLGTKFVISSYPDDEHLKVAVSDGKVSLNDKKNSEPLAYVNPNQLGKINTLGDAKIETLPNLQEFLGWTKGRLVFNETPLSDIKPRLERWYDIKVNIEDPSLLPRKLTASFDKEPLSEVLKVITISLELEHLYDKENRTISFFNHDPNTNQK